MWKWLISITSPEGKNYQMLSTQGWNDPYVASKMLVQWSKMATRDPKLVGLPAGTCIGNAQVVYVPKEK